MASRLMRPPGKSSSPKRAGGEIRRPVTAKPSRTAAGASGRTAGLGRAPRTRAAAIASAPDARFEAVRPGTAITILGRR